jgi:hypothetical protein
MDESGEYLDLERVRDIGYKMDVCNYLYAIEAVSES